MLHYLEARKKVVDAVSASQPRPSVETLGLLEGLGRVLAEDVSADRDYPPFHRSTRDGFALRAADLAAVPARVKRLGEVLLKARREMNTP